MNGIVECAKRELAQFIRFLAESDPKTAETAIAQTTGDFCLFCWIEGAQRHRSVRTRST